MVKTTEKDNSFHKKAPVRLWVKSKFLGFRRNRIHQRPNQALLAIEGVNSARDTQYYLGKRVAYIYKAPVAKQGSKYRAIWGRVAKAHGNKGLVMAKFEPNLPCRAMGATLRVQLYPQRG